MTQLTKPEEQVVDLNTCPLASRKHHDHDAINPEVGVHPRSGVRCLERWLEKMKRLLSIILIPGALVCSGLGSEIDVDRFAEDIEAFQEARTKISDLEHLWKAGGKRTGKEFDPSIYFEIFSHLRPEKGFSLDWVYEYTELGGNPILYLQNQSEAPFRFHQKLIERVEDEAKLDGVQKAWEEYSRKLGELPELKAAPDPFANPGEDPVEKQRRALMERLDEELAKFPRRNYWNWWREGIVCDGTDQGFLELAALFLLGDQFGLYWHSQTNDTEIVPDKDTLHEVIERPVLKNLGIEDQFLPEETKDAARLLAPNPTVLRVDEDILVTLLTFSRWGGFERITLKISDSFPHKVIEESRKTKVEYHCGVIF